MDKIEIVIDKDFESRVHQEVVQYLARSMSWNVIDALKTKVEKSIKEIDQATISRMVTEYLVAEHIGKMKGEK